MRAFADLYDALDTTTSTNGKIEAMVDYFKQAPTQDAAWAVFFLSGQRLKRLITSRQLAKWFEESMQLPDWIFKECYIAVGDTAETIALLNAAWQTDFKIQIAPAIVAENTIQVRQQGLLEAVQETSTLKDDSLTHWIEQRILPLSQLDETRQKETLVHWWSVLEQREVFIVNKLLSGAFRVGVSKKLLIRALTEVSGIAPDILMHRMMGHWEPNPAFFEHLMSEENTQSDVSKPYPFFLAYPIEQSVQDLGSIQDWLLEWKWDGIRAQCIYRDQQVFIWSRGEDLLSDRFPELEDSLRLLPDGTVLDGEILAFSNELPLPFSVLQTRIGRKKLTPQVLSNAPVVYMVYDILEFEGQDVRARSLTERKALLSKVLHASKFPLIPSESLALESWEAAEKLRLESRQRQVEGFVMKRLSSSYQSGRKRGDWWKWKIDPLTIDAVLIYAQAGTGKRANLFTDYTFAVWQDDLLVPVAKAYSGLSNEEIQALDRWIRANTKEKFGPVRSVKATHVFEIGFEGISESKRHKSGIALRFPRILKWRNDKPPEEADTLSHLKGLLHAQT